MSGAESEKDFYTVLGASRDESRSEIERRYRRLAHSHHPDRGGDEEKMKALNEAWRVLGDAERRRAYDRRFSRPRQVYASHAPVSSPGAQADAFSGRLAGAALCLFFGLVLLFMVKVHYVVFLWPLALLAVGIAFCGVLMAHGALSFARERVSEKHPARRLVWAQEIVFWLTVAGGTLLFIIVLRAF